MRTATAVLVAVMACACGAHDDDGPEAAVRRVLDDGVGALNAHDVERAARHLSPWYRDRFGNTRTEIRQLAFFVLGRGPVFVLLRNTKVEVAGPTAHVTTTAYAVQGQPELRKLSDLVPRDADRLELKLTFTLEDGAWRLREVDGDGLDVPGFGG
jgi:hypothetical protein